MEPARDAAPPAHQAVMKHACTSCSRRKIRCDRRQPCTNCVSHARITARKARNNNKNLSAAVDCVYVDPPPVQRHRRRAMPRPSAPAGGLVDRLRVYEDLLQKNNITPPDMLPTAGIASQNEESRSVSSDIDAAERLWIASPWESRMPRSATSASASASAAETPSSAADTLASSEVATETGSLPCASSGEEFADDELDLWQSLAPEVSSSTSTGTGTASSYSVTNSVASQPPGIERLCKALLRLQARCFVLAADSVHHSWPAGRP